MANSTWVSKGREKVNRSLSSSASLERNSAGMSSHVSHWLEVARTNTAFSNPRFATLTKPEIESSFQRQNSRETLFRFTSSSKSSSRKDG